jgi:hypothetical protein
MKSPVSGHNRSLPLRIVFSFFIGLQRRQPWNPTASLPVLYLAARNSDQKCQIWLTRSFY